MLPGTTELILLILIALCIFGLGKLGDISRLIGEMRAPKGGELEEPEAIDITPEHESRADKSADHSD